MFLRWTRPNLQPCATCVHAVGVLSVGPHCVEFLAQRPVAALRVRVGGRAIVRVGPRGGAAPGTGVSVRTPTAAGISCFAEAASMPNPWANGPTGIGSYMPGGVSRFGVCSIAAEQDPQVGSECSCCSHALGGTLPKNSAALPRTRGVARSPSM